jgi:superoxide dismutase, Fe-Mn family
VSFLVDSWLEHIQARAYEQRADRGADSNFIQGAGLLAGAAAGATFVERPAFAQAASPTGGARPVTYEPKPLSLDPKAIKGISEKVLVSHYQNNYVGAVKL